ncbi:hypothetical protein Micbo1qcDRAFT_206454 [Microdochium bolleyi]|uniref:Uncharacterized protein n=1 Tax=Microdochium bolleyi TaxID=196109 RepID=A0A136IX58_9PEZI|nr:hypothetical protein Micbo1qcDRAFT_206454 [Microdochium bolleyi]
MKLNIANLTDAILILLASGTALACPAPPAASSPDFDNLLNTRLREGYELGSFSALTQQLLSFLLPRLRARRHVQALLQHRKCIEVLAAAGCLIIGLATVQVGTVLGCVSGGTDKVCECAGCISQLGDFLDEHGLC